MLKWGISIAVSLVLACILLTFLATPPRTVHRIPIPGHVDKTVDFVLCRAMNGEYGYIFRFGGAETKEPLISSHVPVETLKADARVEYQNQVLTVLGPAGEWLEVPGFVP